MTVVLAVVCSDGVVIGADSQITESDRGLSFPAQKLHPLGSCAAWGGSGPRGVLNDLRPLLQDSATAILEAPDIGGELQERVLPVFKKHYENYIPDLPGEDGGGGVSAYLLAAGYSQGGGSWRSTPTGSSAATRTWASTPSAPARPWPSRPARCCPTSG
ncbi:hypothetical protein AB0H57_16455 [Micromonospora sp. NPDC050686]|uniref:hypothetical protein n=1 Tax=Micromonospora sp. NPDC050686 TaxID=3154631 RepID=UPI0033F27163